MQGTIQQKRLYGIESAIRVVYDLIAKYSSPKINCSNDDNPFLCDAVLLGSLIKSSAEIGISPRPKNPFPGMTFKGLAEQIRGMKVLDDCDYIRKGDDSHRYYESHESHGIKYSIKASIRSLEDELCGVNLESFLPQRTRTIKWKWGLP